MRRSRTMFLLLSAAWVLSMTAGIAACNEPEQPDLSGGESTTFVTDKAPDELSPENAVFAFLQKQKDLGSYKITAEGIAKADFLGYEQKIQNVIYKNGEDYLSQAQSESALVKMKHQSFSKGGKVVYRDNFEGEMKVASKEDYKKVYGLTADDVTLGGYIVNAKTLRYAALEKTEGDTLTYYLRLAGDRSLESGSAVESATAGIRVQAKAYGSLDNLPVFSDVDVRLTVKRDWTPVGYDSECSYDCKKVFEMSVKQTLSCTYSDVNGKVEIPGATEFNEKLGTEPSEVKTFQGETSVFMQMTSALGGALDETGALSLPVTANVNTFGAPFDLNGTLDVKLKKEALNRGEFSDAFTARLDVSLSNVPLVSDIANTLTVRYPGDGVLLLMLGNEEGYPVTYAADLSAFGFKGLDGLSAGDLQSAAEKVVTIEKTATGYSVALKPALVEKLNEAFGNLLGKLETKLGDTHGLVRSLLGTTLTGLTVELNGLEKTTGVSLAVEGALENVTKGEKIGVSIDTKLLGGAIQAPITGDLMIRLDPTAVWSGDYYAIAKAHLFLDFTPAADLLDMLGMFSSVAQIPAFLGAMRSLDLYYTGDGILTIGFNDEAGLPINVSEVDLKQISAGNVSALDGEEQPSVSLLPFILTVDKNSVKFALGESTVAAIAAAYNWLIEGLVADAKEAMGNDPFMGPMAETVLRGFLDAEINAVEFFLGASPENKTMFDFSIKGVPYQNTETVRLLGFTLTDKEALTEDERDALTAGMGAAKLKEQNAKAADYTKRLQTLIDGLDVTDDGKDAYLDKVTALQNEINAQEGAEKIKSLMANGSYLAAVNDQDTKIVLTAKLYRARVEDFKGKLQAVSETSDEAAWDALNALYDSAKSESGISVPAIKSDDVLLAAIGEHAIQDYLTKRDAHETAMAEDLATKIQAANEAFESAETRDELTAALTRIVKEFKPAYDKLPAEKQANTGYQDYLSNVYFKNIDAVTKEFQAVQTTLTDLLAEPEKATIDALIDAMEALAAADAWAYGYNYWETTSNSDPMEWGAWVNALKPANVSAEQSQKISALTTVKNALIKGVTAKEIATQFKELIHDNVKELMEQVSPCRTAGTDGAADTWNFELLGLEDAAEKTALLKKIHGFRYMISKVLPNAQCNAIWDEDIAKKISKHILIIGMKKSSA